MRRIDVMYDDGPSPRVSSSSVYRNAGRRRDGVISGYVFKVVRETLGLTQEALAELLAVDTNTVQGWETGRRCLAGTPTARFAELRRRLGSLGAPARLIGALAAAMDADYILGHALATDPDRIKPATHPLGNWVLTRSISEMLAWPFTGRLPTALQGVSPPTRRGPVAALPALSPAERRAFFDHYRAAAERSLLTRDRTDMGGVLLRRQAYYQLAWSTDGDARSWLEHAEREEQRGLGRVHGWSPSWVAARSLAVARARVGDREPLADFIRTGFDHDQCEYANLNYWAYWVGETASTEHADVFMTTDLGQWTGIHILPRMEHRLVPRNECIDLYIHSIWALFRRSTVPFLLLADTALWKSLRERIETLLDEPNMSQQSRRELAEVRCGILALEPPVVGSGTRSEDRNGRWLRRSSRGSPDTPTR